MINPTTKSWLTLGLLTHLTFIAPGGAAEKGPGARAPSDDTVVGSLGRREFIAIEGNTTFTKDQILDGMAWHLDYHLAAHPAALLVGFSTLLEHKIRLGYQRAGFPKVSVTTTVIPGSRGVSVRVNEGPRYRCGNLILSGVPSMTNATVRKSILDGFNGASSPPAPSTHSTALLWSQGQPAPFDGPAAEQLRDLVLTAIESLDYYQPRFSVRIAPDPVRRAADLLVEISDEGVKGTIEQIEVTGLRTNTRQQVLDYLKLAPGMELHGSLVNTVSNQLAQSARFFHQEIRLQPERQVGRFRLELDLEELRAAPPLSQEFSPLDRALLKLRERLMDWQKNPESFACSLSFTTALARLNVDAVIASSGIAAVSRSDSTNGPPILRYGVVAASKELGIYSAWRQKKFKFDRTAGTLQGRIILTPDSHQDGEKFNMQILGGFSSKEALQPFSLLVDLAPVAFIQAARSTNLGSSLKDGILTLLATNEQRQVWLEARVEAASGRLLNGTVRFDDGVLRIESREGAFEQTIREIGTATAGHPNDYVPGQGFSSGLAYLATDLIESPLTEPLLRLWSEDIQARGQSADPASILPMLKPLMAWARDSLDTARLARVFEPLNRLFPEAPDDDPDDSFFVPLESALAIQSASSVTRLACAWVLASADRLLTPNSWPWILLREASFTLAGQGRYSQTQMEDLLKSNDMGPLGCAAAARLLGRPSPDLARAFAERGIARLSLEEFRKDYRLLLQNPSIASEVLGNALGLAGGLTGQQVSLVTAKLPATEASFLRQVAGLIRDARTRPAGEAAWPAFEQHWQGLIRPRLLRELSRFMPQVEFLSDANALNDRGMALIAPDAVLQDFDEAAQCFRKAAELGHAGAQMNLGRLQESGQGTRQDLAEAMRWYRKAAEQKEPHAACRIADLYRDGKGVRVDLDEAVKWYLIEAEGECSGAQFQLGKIHDAQNNTPEALRWYRRAANAGAVAAQSRLGDLLGEGVFSTPDYPEACQWLILASRTGDKTSEVRLRRVKARLTTEQLAVAEEKAAAIERRLTEKEKERAKKPEARPK